MSAVIRATGRRACQVDVARGQGLTSVSLGLWKQVALKSLSASRLRSGSGRSEAKPGLSRPRELPPALTPDPESATSTQTFRARPGSNTVKSPALVSREVPSIRAAKLEWDKLPFLSISTLYALVIHGSNIPSRPLDCSVQQDKRSGLKNSIPFNRPSTVNAFSIVLWPCDQKSAEATAGMVRSILSRGT